MLIDKDRNLIIDQDKFIKNSEVVDIDDVIIGFRRQIESGRLSEEALAYILKAIRDYEGDITRYVKFHIHMIYFNLLIYKYSEKESKYTAEFGYLGYILGSVVYLNKLGLIGKKNGFINIAELCNEVYNEIVFGRQFKEYNLKPFKIEQGLEPEHLLDMEYHLKNIKEWNKDDTEFVNKLNEKSLEVLCYAST